MSTLVSVHDVMPDTLARVLDILDTLRQADVPTTKTYLLVVPGLRWTEAQIERLRALQQAGYPLAGHGWQHRVHRKRGIGHHLHAALISRNAAEHLSLSTAEIRDMIQANYAWFAEHRLAPPQLYVPPAWAMGAISRRELELLPFRFYEYTSGILDTGTRRYHPLALLGYEADKRWRAPLLKLWNTLNKAWLSRRRPLRVAIHPFDFDYHLAQNIVPDLQRDQHYLDCNEACHQTGE